MFSRWRPPSRSSVGLALMGLGARAEGGGDEAAPWRAGKGSAARGAVFTTEGGYGADPGTAEGSAPAGASARNDELELAKRIAQQEREATPLPFSPPPSTFSPGTVSVTPGSTATGIRITTGAAGAGARQSVATTPGTARAAELQAQRAADAALEALNRAAAEAERQWWQKYGADVEFCRHTDNTIYNTGVRIDRLNAETFARRAALLTECRRARASDAAVAREEREREARAKGESPFDEEKGEEVEEGDGDLAPKKLSPLIYFGLGAAGLVGLALIFRGRKR